MKVLWAVARALFIFLSGVAVTLRGANTPTQKFWDHRPWLFYGAVAVVGLGAVLPAVVNSVRRGQLERSLSRARNVETLLKGAFLRIHKATGIPASELGVEAYLTGRERWHPLRPVLVRHAQIRLTASKRAGHIRWSRGKGVLGTCWAKGQWVAVDVAGLTADWDDRPEAERLGMNEEEARSIGDYGSIVAQPIFDDSGRVRGSVTADAPSHRLSTLDASPVQAELAEAASSVWIGAHSTVGEA